MKEFADMTVAEQSVVIAERAVQVVTETTEALRAADKADPDIEVVVRDLRNVVRFLEGCIHQCGQHGVRDHHERWRAIAAEGNRVATERAGSES